MLQTVCDKKVCTACGACINICPKHCISFNRDEYGVKHAYIDMEKCIHCNMCYKVCPVFTELRGNIPKVCYAAWSNNNYIRTHSASGGIASELYQYAENENFWIAGVYLNDRFEAIYSLEKDNWYKFQNSKYTFSDMGELYCDVAQKLQNREKILYIGLPCQIAGLKLFLQAKNIYDDNLFVVDLVCHGVTPDNYLKEHIKNKEQRMRRKITEVFFRNPKYNTYLFYFTLGDRGRVFYKKKVDSTDEYQIAYHKGIAYRENCYVCPWAKYERLGDITLSDFPGLGSEEKCRYPLENVSCIMLNTKKGVLLHNELVHRGKIFSEQRPLEENFNSQVTLNNPTPIPPERAIFLNYYKDKGEFDYALKKAAKKTIQSNVLNHILRYRNIKLFILKHIPRETKDRVKEVLKKLN